MVGETKIKKDIYYCFRISIMLVFYLLDFVKMNFLFLYSCWRYVVLSIVIIFIIIFVLLRMLLVMFKVLVIFGLLMLSGFFSMSFLCVVLVVLILGMIL